MVSALLIRYSPCNVKYFEIKIYWSNRIINGTVRHKSNGSLDMLLNKHLQVTTSVVVVEGHIVITTEVLLILVENGFESPAACQTFSKMSHQEVCGTHLAMHLSLSSPVPALLQISASLKSTLFQKLELESIM
jgi:hypothetical protein